MRRVAEVGDHLVARERQLQDLGAVEDLVGEPVGRLVDVDRAGEPQVGGELHVVAGRQVELGRALAERISIAERNRLK